MPIKAFARCAATTPKRWQHCSGGEASSGPHKAARVEEYRELARALEIEIVAALGLPT